jgi:hypothetical protein
MKTTMLLRVWRTNLWGGSEANDVYRSGVFAGTTVNPAAASMFSLFCTCAAQAATAMHAAMTARVDLI